MSEKVDAPTSSEASGVNGAGPKAVIKNVDMSEEMQQEAVDVASVALEKYNIEKDIAAQIKKEFDRRHGPTWHVVVGKNFGSYVTHGAPRPLRRPRRAAAPCADRARRDETLHLLLHRPARDPHLEVMSAPRAPHRTHTPPSPAIGRASPASRAGVLPSYNPRARPCADGSFVSIPLMDRARLL